MYLNKGDFELAKKYCQVGGLYMSSVAACLGVCVCGGGGGGGG